MHQTKPGFTLIEVVVAAVILAILAAITVPQVMDSLDKQRVEDTYSLLQEIHYSITNTNQTGFMNVVRSGTALTTSSNAPGRLTHLTEPIVQLTASTYHNSCGSAVTTTGISVYTTTSATTWTNGGPFLQRAVSFNDGIALPIGQLQNILVRTANPNTTPAFLQLRINNVDPNDAAALDLRVDGIADVNNGTIRYTTTSGVSTVNYLIPVPNRC